MTVRFWLKGDIPTQRDLSMLAYLAQKLMPTRGWRFLNVDCAPKTMAEPLNAGYADSDGWGIRD
jgi:hypothetical protein